MRVELDNDPTVVQEVKEEDFKCYNCDLSEPLYWCEWCGHWECAVDRCCTECGGDHYMHEEDRN